MEEIIGFLKLALITATPIALGALGGIMSERAGIVNIGIEGMMLTAAMVSQLVAMYINLIFNPTISLIIGLIFGLATGALLGWLHGIISIKFKTDQIISGTIINIFAWGITGWAYQRWMSNTVNTPPSPGTFPILPIPGLSKIPIIGELLFNHQPIVYSMLILTFLIHYLLFYTPWGLRTRAVGEHPRAADTVGINIYKIRYINTILGGMIASLAGVWLTLEQVGNFNLRMSAGRGFIALAAMIFGRWTPFGAFGASLLFGTGIAIQIYTASLTSAATYDSWLINIPSQFYQALPYIITVIILAGFGGKAIPPAADGKPYKRNEK